MHRLRLGRGRRTSSAYRPYRLVGNHNAAEVGAKPGQAVLDLRPNHRLHPAGVPHGPHPGAYEGSIGTRSTDEIAVMMDTFAPLRLTQQALALESAGYHDSWIPG